MPTTDRPPAVLSSAPDARKSSLPPAPRCGVHRAGRKFREIKKWKKTRGRESFLQLLPNDDVDNTAPARATPGKDAREVHRDVGAPPARLPRINCTPPAARVCMIIRVVRLLRDNSAAASPMYSEPCLAVYLLPCLPAFVAAGERNRRRLFLSSAPPPGALLSRQRGWPTKAALLLQLMCAAASYALWCCCSREARWHLLLRPRLRLLCLALQYDGWCRERNWSCRNKSISRRKRRKGGGAGLEIAPVDSPRAAAGMQLCLMRVPFRSVLTAAACFLCSQLQRFFPSDSSWCISIVPAAALFIFFGRLGRYYKMKTIVYDLRLCRRVEIEWYVWSFSHLARVRTV